MNNLLQQTLAICLTALTILLFSFQPAEAESVKSTEKDYTILPENGVIIAAFFPGNSTFSHSRLKNSVSRKKKKNKKILKRNRFHFDKFTKNEKTLIASFEKIEKTNRILFYWQLGEAISREEQKLIKIKSYYPFLIQNLALSLNIPEQNIEKTKLFYQAYPVIAFVPKTLLWNHFDLLLDISDDSDRVFYQTHVIENNVTPDELRILINSNVHETADHEE